MIYESLDTTKTRLRDAIRRREQGLQPADNEDELLERALRAIEHLQHGEPL